MFTFQHSITKTLPEWPDPALVMQRIQYCRSGLVHETIYWQDGSMSRCQDRQFCVDNEYYNDRTDNFTLCAYRRVIIWEMKHLLLLTALCLNCGQRCRVRIWQSGFKMLDMLAVYLDQNPLMLPQAYQPVAQLQSTSFDCLAMCTMGTLSHCFWWIGHKKKVEAI